MAGTNTTEHAQNHVDTCTNMLTSARIHTHIRALMHTEHTCTSHPRNIGMSISQRVCMYKVVAQGGGQAVAYMSRLVVLHQPVLDTLGCVCAGVYVYVYVYVLV